MPAMPAVKTVGELYPPRADAAVSALVETIVVFRPSGPGKPAELSRALSTTERAAISARAGVIAKWLEPGRQGEIAKSVSGMLLGFGRSMSLDDAMEIAAQWAHALRDLPGWAVERACMRFARGEVRATELGIERLDVGFAPSTAQLHRIASAIAGDLEKERRKIEEVLRGTASLARAPAEKVSAAGVIAGHLKAKEEERAVNQEERQRRIEVGAAERRSKERAAAEKTFRDAGLDPPAWKPGTVPVTLQMYLRNGYEIGAGENGKPVLLSPAKRVG